jgi:hypothetical protein
MLTDILIFGGQSNMQGQTESLIPTENNGLCFEYKYLTDTIVPLADPVGENIRYDRSCGYPVTKEGSVGTWLEDHVAGMACYGNTNMVPSFCKTYSELTGRTVVAVHAAKGSTVIAQWLPGTAGYGMLKDKALAAIDKVAKDFTVGNIFFVWLQGESDAIEGNGKRYYMEKLTELAGALKTDVGIERFGIIRVGRFTNDQRDLEIIDAQDEICKENGFFLMLTRIATELNLCVRYMNPDVKGHYSAEGLIKLGDEAARTLVAFVTE